MVSAASTPADSWNSAAYGPSGIKGLVQEPYLFSLACFASIGGVLFGYDQGVISGVLVMSSFVSLPGFPASAHLERAADVHQADLFPSLAHDAGLQGWMVSVLTLGAMFGAFVNGPICDRFSRRWSLLYANIAFLAGSVLQCAAQDIPMIFVGRFLAGFAIGMLSMVVPLYISELAPPNIRGSLVALQQLGITVGIMVAFWLEYGTQYIGGTGSHQSEAAWRFPLAFQCVPSLVLGAGAFFLPYSPRWLMMQGMSLEAGIILTQVLIRFLQDAKKKHVVLWCDCDA